MWAIGTICRAGVTNASVVSAFRMPPTRWLHAEHIGMCGAFGFGVGLLLAVHPLTSVRAGTHADALQDHDHHDSYGKFTTLLTRTQNNKYRECSAHEFHMERRLASVRNACPSFHRLDSGGDAKLKAATTKNDAAVAA